jgi:hypothetical protein
VTGAVLRVAQRRGVMPAARLGLIVAVALLVLWRVDWHAADLALHPESWGLLVLAIAANFTSVVFKGAAWKGVVDALPGLSHRTRLRDLLSPLFVGFLFNTVLAARLGEIVKVLLLRRRLVHRGSPVPATTLLGTVVAENLVSTIAWVALVVSIGLFLPLPAYAWAASVALGAVCVVVVSFALMTATGRQLPPWLSSGTLWARVCRAASRVWGAVRESHLGLRDPRQMSVVAGGSLMCWLAQWAGIYFCLDAFGLERVGWGGAGLLLVTITLAQSFPILPGNLVLFQAAAMLPLTTSYGVGAAEAIAFALVLQFTEVVVGVAFGFLFLMAEGVGFGQLRRQAQAERALETAST